MARMPNSQRRIVPDPSDYRRAPSQQSASRSRPAVRWHDPFRAVLALGRREARKGLVRIRVKGDFIRGRHAVTGKLHSVDADHLAPWLHGRRSGDGVEGGTFESWFTVAAG